MTLRSIVKGIVESDGIGRPLAELARRRRYGASLTLAYHNVTAPGLPSAWGDTSLHLPADAFARQLDHIASHYSVVPLDEVLSQGAPDAPPRVAITFDDAYVGALTHGVRELRARSLPATIFVAPGRFESTFWWDTLADGRGLDDEVRAHVLGALAGREDEAVRWAASVGRGRAASPAPDYVCASEELLRAALEYPALTIASHSWSHPNLSRVAPGALEEELVRSAERVKEIGGGQARPYISYPYGLSNECVAGAAIAAGYRAGFLIAGGWARCATTTARAFAWPRLNVPAGISDAGFALRVAGVLRGSAA